jgi:hypothetical protein
LPPLPGLCSAHSFCTQLGRPGELTNARSFFAGIEVEPLDYSPALELADPLTASVPFPPSYEDRTLSVEEGAIAARIEGVTQGSRKRHDCGMRA